MTDGPQKQVPASAEQSSFTQRMVEVFLTGNLTPLVILVSLIAGAFALLLTPREEEPQIVVPLADVYIEVPGASAEEVEHQVTTRLEKLLNQIDGVEHVYSMSMPHRSIVTVRFFVGEGREKSLVKLYNKLQSNVDRLPRQVAGWVVKPVEVDDVPLLGITLWSEELDDYALRRVAEEIETRVQAVPNTGRTEIIGGRPRRVGVYIDPTRLEAQGVPLGQVQRALQAVSTSLPAGGIDTGGERVLIEAGALQIPVHELQRLVIGMRYGAPVYLEDVAEVVDGASEVSSYVRIGFGTHAGDDVPESYRDPSKDYAAVTVAVAKRKGSNAVWVAKDLRKRVEELRQEIIPEGVFIHYTRDHGETSNHKVNELIEGLVVAIIIVIALIALSLGSREGLVVATAVPITFALTLLVNYLAGYSINRVTLFALTLALGLVVDDPIVDVENIHRHLAMRRKKPLQAVLDAINEVRPPIILATLAVMVSFLPMFFITGMMGPYMRPMALNVPLSMFMSLVVAFTVTPWLSYLVLRKQHEKHGGDEPLTDEHAEMPVDTEGLMYRAYAGTMRPLLHSRALRWLCLLVTALLFGASGYLAMGRQVPLKMLPFDNKNEVQVVIDMPEGSSLERTEAVAAELAARIRGYQEVVDVTSYAGTASPMDFNGMVRHYYLRGEAHHADLRVNLVHKELREIQSHDFATQLRLELKPLAAAHGARIKVVETPPGPPVIATLTVEVYGPPHIKYQRLTEAAAMVRERLDREIGAVDADDSGEAPQKVLRFVLDREKAALHQIGEAQVAQLLQTAIQGSQVAVLHHLTESHPLPLILRLPKELRSSVAELERMRVVSPAGDAVALGEIGRFVQEQRQPTIYHKNLRRVAYVFVEVAGRAPAELILDMQADRVAESELASALAAAPQEQRPLEQRSYFNNGSAMPWAVPEGIELDWSGEGEWQITLDVFRDLGLAFLAACLGIYVLLVYETDSYFLPLILMLSIPFTIIGIFPGFWLLRMMADSPVPGVESPVFFTATAMIGMIALSGIAVRNAILLIEFLHRALDEGRSLFDAILESGAVRFRPIFLTAGTAMLAALPITLDPIFSGLAWALIFGLLVSSAFTLILVPMVYWMVYAKKHARREQ
ncbi:MAG: acriflavine resistance protein B [Planctomycetota bacterium]|nr:MAG: acriflavine resistance protein B [Planctomycetota bacterium]